MTNKLFKWLAIASISVTSGFVHADIKGLGTNYRVLLSNYEMINQFRSHCKDIKYPELPRRNQVERMTQDKLGIEMYVQASIAIQKSDLRKNAKASVDQLMESMEGCDDPRIARALTKIELSHIQAYARVEAEPALVPPKAVPVPLKRN